jgi:transcriptional regulator with XRE-family HTH domain
MADNDPKNLIRISHENGESGVAQPLDLGARVRELRKASDWTLEQAAQQAGLARSTLSKIENSQMSPTYYAQKKLAVGLGISVQQLFTPSSKGQVNGRMAVTRDGEETAKVNHL